MITETKEVYKCEYCRKLYQIKRFAIYHESICSKNPANDRPCFNCQNMTTENYEYGDDGEGYRTKNLNLFFCNAKQIFIHTPKNEIKKNAFELGDSENNPMPKECELYNPHELLEFEKTPFE